MSAELAVKQSKFLDWLKEEFNVKNDAQLSRDLEIAPPAVCKVRKGDMPVGASLILRIHEQYGVSVKKIRAQLAD